jgi:hypothetical protein
MNGRIDLNLLHIMNSQTPVQPFFSVLFALVLTIEQPYPDYRVYQLTII